MVLKEKEGIKIFITFLLIYSLFVRWLGASENSRFALVMAIVDENKFEIDSFFNMTSDRTLFSNHYYSDKEPGLSFVATPIYSFWKLIYESLIRRFIKVEQKTPVYITYYVGIKKSPIFEQLNPSSFFLVSIILVTIFTSSVFSSLTVFLIYKFLKLITKKKLPIILTTFIAGFATLIFPYSQVFLNHSFSTFLTFLTFLTLFKMRIEKKFGNNVLFLTGILTGFLVLTGVLMIVFMFFFLLYLYFSISKKVKLVYFLLGIILGIFPIIVYNIFVFNYPFPLPIYRYYLDPEIWGIAKVRQGIPLPKPFLLFLPIPDFFVFYRLTLDTYNGLFFLYPILLFFFPGIYMFYKKYKVEALLFLALIFSYIFANSCEWWWDSYFGPRHLTPLSPFLVLPIAFVLQKSDRRILIIVILLFLYSLLVNFASTAPSKLFLQTDETGIELSQEYKEKVRSFEILANPIYDYYIPEFILKGPRSRILEDIINGNLPDIRFLTPEKREYFHLFYYCFSFLPLLITSLILLLIWGRGKLIYGVKNFVVESKSRLILIIFLLTAFLIFIFFALSPSEEMIYYKGWFPEEDGEKWMGRRGILIIYNRMNSEKSVIISFYARSYMKDRSIYIYLNDILIDSFIIFPQTSRFLTREIRLKPGLNFLVFDSVEGCEIPNIVEGINDYRCLSIAFSNISLNLASNENKIFIKENFYLPQENVLWMRQDGKIMILNDDFSPKIVLLHFVVKSFYKERDIFLTLNNKVIDSFAALKEETIYAFPLNLTERENFIILHVIENCTIVAEVEGNNDYRCLSIGIFNVSVMSLNKNQSYFIVFNKGWYLAPFDSLRPMSKRASILILSNADDNSTKLVSIYLKSIKKDKKIRIIFNGEKEWQLYVFKEGSHIILPLNLRRGVNILEFLSDECEILLESNDTRCISLGVDNIEIKAKDENELLIINSINWYDKDPKEEVRWMRNNATVYIFNSDINPKNVTFYFYFVSPIGKRTVHFFLNEEEKNVFLILNGGEVYTERLTLRPGENILRFYVEEECIEIAKLAKNDDYRCVTVGLKYINLK